MSNMLVLFHYIIFIKKLSIQEILEALGIEIDGLDIDLDDIDLNNLDQLLSLIRSLLGLNLDYLSWWSLIFSLLVILGLAIKTRKIIELDLTPIIIKKGNNYYKGVIDLKDPSGSFLKFLFVLNTNNVESIIIYCPELMPSVRRCVYFNKPISSNFKTSYDILGNYPYDSQDYHVSINFESPNRIWWLFLSSIFDLKIVTGFDEYLITILPNWGNLDSIEVRGLLSTLIDNNRPSPPSFDGT
jgi:hypothetical protein